MHWASSDGCFLFLVPHSLITPRLCLQGFLCATSARWSSPTQSRRPSLWALHPAQRLGSGLEQEASVIASGPLVSGNRRWAVQPVERNRTLENLPGPLLLIFHGPLKYSSGFISLMGFKRSNFLRHEIGQYKKNIKEKFFLRNEREKII